MATPQAGDVWILPNPHNMNLVQLQLWSPIVLLLYPADPIGLTDLTNYFVGLDIWTIKYGLPQQETETYGKMKEKLKRNRESKQQKPKETRFNLRRSAWAEYSRPRHQPPALVEMPTTAVR